MRLFSSGVHGHCFVYRRKRHLVAKWAKLKVAIEVRQATAGSGVGYPL